MKSVPKIKIKTHKQKYYKPIEKDFTWDTSIILKVICQKPFYQVVTLISSYSLRINFGHTSIRLNYVEEN